MLREVNFDGLIGPSHNYAGLSPGNLAATRNAGRIAQPRRAALEGVGKMRGALTLGLAQGMLMPLDRPDERWLAALATDYSAASPHLRAQALSASAMWAANAATVSPAPDTADGRCHLTVANLLTMPHRSHEWQGTLAQLRLAFAHPTFAVHGPVPPPFGDEGAANHMRLCTAHDRSALEIFVHGVSGGPFPVRQHLEASMAVARMHGVDPGRVIFAEQSEQAIAAGAFHNDVVAVANEHVLFGHELAFAEKERFYRNVQARLPEVEIIEVPAARVSLADAVTSYLFNAQLVTLPDASMALILPEEARDNLAVWTWLQELVAGNTSIRRLEVVDVRQSMANGGGPACLRLRVVTDTATIDPRFLVDSGKLDLVEQIVFDHWPHEIAPDAIGSSALIADIRRARRVLLEALDLVELINS